MASLSGNLALALGTETLDCTFIVKKHDMMEQNEK